MTGTMRRLSPCGASCWPPRPPRARAPTSRPTPSKVVDAYVAADRRARVVRLAAHRDDLRARSRRSLTWRRRRRRERPDRRVEPHTQLGPFQIPEGCRRHGPAGASIRAARSHARRQGSRGRAREHVVRERPVAHARTRAAARVRVAGDREGLGPGRYTVLEVTPPVGGRGATAFNTRPGSSIASDHAARPAVTIDERAVRLPRASARAATRSRSVDRDRRHAGERPHGHDRLGVVEPGRSTRRVFAHAVAARANRITWLKTPGHGDAAVPTTRAATCG